MGSYNLKIIKLMNITLKNDKVLKFGLPLGSQNDQFDTIRTICSFKTKIIY